jgi:hypothetical protein
MIELNAEEQQAAAEFIGMMKRLQVERRLRQFDSCINALLTV